MFSTSPVVVKFGTFPENRGTSSSCIPNVTWDQHYCGMYMLVKYPRKEKLLLPVQPKRNMAVLTSVNWSIGSFTDPFKDFGLPNDRLVELISIGCQFVLPGLKEGSSQSAMVSTWPPCPTIEVGVLGVSTWSL
jgi:hypothetical protein